jgi:hypothetical protein
MSETEAPKLAKLRLRVARAELVAELLRANAHKDFADSAADKNADRVTLSPVTGEPDPNSVAAIAQEILAAAGAGRSVYEAIVREMKARAEREARETRERQEILDRMIAGGR